MPNSSGLSGRLAGGLSMPMHLIGFGAFTPGTSVTNLILKSEQFNNAAWGNDPGVTITANSTTDPIGGSTADTYGSNTHVDDGYLFVQQGPISVTTGNYTLSLYAKYVSRQWVSLSIYDTGPGAHFRAWFDVQNGVAGTKAAGVGNSGITSIGSGWYRIWLTRNVTGTSVYFNLLDSGADNSIAAAGAASTYIWGAQIETGTTPGTYTATP